jgi:hypothetical protein
MVVVAVALLFGFESVTPGGAVIVAVFESVRLGVAVELTVALTV